jgi:hypothetical protein
MISNGRFFTITLQPPPPIPEHRPLNLNFGHPNFKEMILPLVNAFKQPLPTKETLQQTKLYSIIGLDTLFIITLKFIRLPALRVS